MEPTLFDPDVRFTQDVTYLEADRAEKLDIYLPPECSEGSPYPVVLLIHGGGWRMLDKGMAREKNIGYTLAKAGYAVFSINYLLNEVTRDDANNIVSEKVAWPQNFYDCKSALRWIRKEAATYNIDSGRIATMGGSAGGHLAMLVAATANADEMNQGGLYTEQSNEVTCVLNFYGVSMPRDNWQACFAGATPEATAANLKAAAPINYFDDGFPPIFITHGSADTIVGVEYSRELVDELVKRNLTYWYVEIGGAPHTYHLQPKQMDLRPSVLQFLEEQLRRA